METQNGICVDAVGQDAEKTYSKYFEKFYKDLQKKKEAYLERISLAMQNAIAFNNLQKNTS